MNKSLVLKSVIIAGGLIISAEGITACGSSPHYTTAANTTYCVNQQSGEVMPPEYCQVGGSYYNPGLYDFWIGYTYGHSYRPGTIIQHNYFTSGRQVSPSNSSARKAAGIPVSGSVSNGAKSTTTTRTQTGSTPAKPQNGPSRSGVSGSTSKSSTTTTRPSTTTPRTSTFGGSGSSSRSSSTFGSSGSSSRSSSSFGSSSGGRR